MTLPGTPSDPSESGSRAARSETDAGPASAETVENGPATPEDDLRRVREELEAIDASRTTAAEAPRRGFFGRREEKAATVAPVAPAVTLTDRPEGEPSPVEPAVDLGPSPAADPDPTNTTTASASASPLFAEQKTLSGRPRSDDPSSRRLAYRLETPARFETNGETHRTLDWSLGGFAIPPGRHRFRQDERLHGTFTVQLDDFVVSTPVTVEVVYIDRKRVGCRFTELSHSQIRMLRSLAGALMAGHLPMTIGLGDAARKRRLAHVRERGSRPPALVRLLSGLLNGLLAVVVVGIGLFVFFTPIEPTFVAETGAVAVPRIVVAAPATGSVAELTAQAGEEVVPGSSLGYLRQQNGGRVRYDSTCYCVVRSLAEPGKGVREGEPIATLYSSTAQPVVQAIFSRKDEVALVPGRSVIIRLPYAGRSMSGAITRVTNGIEDDWIGLPPTIAASPDRVVAWIEPATALDIAAVGEPVTVSFEPSTGL